MLGVGRPQDQRAEAVPSRAARVVGRIEIFAPVERLGDSVAERLVELDAPGEDCLEDRLDIRIGLVGADATPDAEPVSVPQGPGDRVDGAVGDENRSRPVEVAPSAGIVVGALPGLLR